PPTDVVRVVGDTVLVERLSGAPPPCPLFACQRRERKRSQPRSALGKAIRQRDDHTRHAETRKRQHPPTACTKAVFSLESEGFLFDKTKRNLSELGSRDGKPLLCPRALPARRQVPAAVGRRSLVTL